MTEFTNYKELEAWQVAMELVELTYRVTTRLPETEKYGLIAQMRRAAVSIPSNIAEGQARGLTRACINYLAIALGSLAELDTQAELAFRLNYLTREGSAELQLLIQSSRKLAYGLRRSKLQRLGISSAGTAIMLSFVLGLLV
jgi:four helix bundle protein